jgi:DNA-binding response OmpR family regulator
MALFLRIGAHCFEHAGSVQRRAAGVALTGAEKTLTLSALGAPDNRRGRRDRRPSVERLATVSNTARVAIIEDDPPTSDQLKGWILSARPGLQVDQWFTRDEAEAAIARERYDLVVMDIELGRERHAGVALINAINKQHGTPVLVVSAMPATIYRSIMKALDAWDYLQKTAFEESDFIDTVLEMLRASKDRPAAKPAVTTAVDQELSIDPLGQGAVLWRGHRVNLPLTAQRILAALHAHRGEVVSYDDLFQVVKTGRNRDNVRKHISTIREAFRDIDPAFEGIESVPMRGFRWLATPAAAGH